MPFVTAIIIGAGQCGLAMSSNLTDLSIDHVILEQNGVANAWETERWDSLRLLTPNWQSRLPHFKYSGKDPDGYMSAREVSAYLKAYAAHITAPVKGNTRVINVRSRDPGYDVTTTNGQWQCRTLVIASGASRLPSVPSVATALPNDILSMTPLTYRNPSQLPSGGVLIVGASASGVQLAFELLAAGRDVVVSVGEHTRAPRTYRGQDISWWMDSLGIMDVRYDEIGDIDRARRVPSLQLIGTREHELTDLNALQQTGAEIVGRLAEMSDSKVQFSGALVHQCAMADLKMLRLLSSIDSWVRSSGDQVRFPEAEHPAPTRVPDRTRLNLDLRDRKIGTVIWATGYCPDYSWLGVPVLDRKGRLKHDGGHTPAPGLYVLGLPFLRRRKSSLIDGAGADAADLARHLHASLARAAA